LNNGADTGRMRLRRGSLYFTAALHGRYFGGVETVILLREDADLLIMRVAHAAAGGYLIKLRNRAGDRVIHGADFFRNHGLGDEQEFSFTPRWCQTRSALVADGLFHNNM